MEFDVLIIGSGPGGYVAAIRASQLGMKVGVVEKAELGGVCLNWGCIPTKALLKSAQVLDYVNHAGDYGVICETKPQADLERMVRRSREVAEKMSKGVQFLFKKNNIELIAGHGSVADNRHVVVRDAAGNETRHKSAHIILATGARPRELPNLKPDGERIISYREALTQKTIPGRLLVVGAGAIGSEFAYFYSTLGSRVTLVEFLPGIVPLEDEEVSRQLERSFRKNGMEVMTSSSVEKVEVEGRVCHVSIQTPKGIQIRDADLVLSAAGVSPNLENLGLEALGIAIEKGKIRVDEFYRTSVRGVYAIGDIVGGPALAHVASAEGIVCVEKIAGKSPAPVNYNNIPSCTYTYPEIASVGYTEKTAGEAGFEVRIGKFPFTASGKATASGHKDGFVKLVFDARYGELLGAHLIGENVTEMIGGLAMARNLETTGHEIIKTIHPHPTMSEAIMEAAAEAYGEVIHI